MTSVNDVDRALRATPPHALLDTLRTLLTDVWGATGADLLMADYGLTVLQPVEAPGDPSRAVSLHNSAEGRAFGSQAPHEEHPRHGEYLRLHLPVTARGERLGVLTVRLPPGSVGVEVTDELAQVAELLGHEIVVAERDTDVYRQARRVGRLTLAAEMQWELLPGRASAREEFSIGAQLEPAYAVRGDNFDWSSDADRLSLSILNGMGDGIHASLLTQLAVGSLRNARRADLPVADQARLADQAIYAQHHGDQHVSALLLSFDLATGRVLAVDAGSPRLWRRRGTAVERIELEAQLPLGMFEESDYLPQEFAVLPGDRLLVVSDGVYDALSPLGEAFGERALARAVTATALLPAADVPRAVLDELAGYRVTEPLDDALIVCLDWFGRQRREGSGPQTG
ncbi:PP2C family protein-serine/threonine phosphatase [Streptomyces sp. NBC_01176]|uniref:PP2C family protein-serine/threonine phosphatase n=1 Tax=Streptomyces sp. NBC_01176 TaxID=2903760 RepID=UPI0038680B37